MTLQEFSNEFDVLYNNIMSNAAPGLNEYEKSVFLTQAQEEFIVAAYSGRLQGIDSFEGTEEVKKYLDNLIISISIYPNSNLTLNRNGVSFSVPPDILFTVYEQVKDINGVIYPINNITHDEYNFVLKNPFRGPLSGRVMCLTNADYEKELIPPEGVKLDEYNIKCIMTPPPIILADISSIGATIHNIDTESDCILNSITHLMILKLAVQKAAQAYKQ